MDINEEEWHKMDDRMMFLPPPPSNDEDVQHFVQSMSMQENEYKMINNINIGRRHHQLIYSFAKIYHDNPYLKKVKKVSSEYMNTFKDYYYY